MECATCGGPTHFLEPNGNWWCNTCLAATEGPGPSAVDGEAEKPSLVDEVAMTAGTNALDIVAWIAGGILIAAGITLLVAGWNKSGWTLVGVGVLIGATGLMPL